MSPSTEMNMSFSHDMDDEYEKLIKRMNPPRVVNNNESCKNATVIRIDSAKKHGILLEVVQILTDLNLIATKALKPIYLLMAIGSWMVFQTLVMNTIVPPPSLSTGCKEMFSRNWEVLVQHEYREAKRAADFLAKQGLQLPFWYQDNRHVCCCCDGENFDSRYLGVCCPKDYICLS